MDVICSDSEWFPPSIKHPYHPLILVAFVLQSIGTWRFIFFPGEILMRALIICLDPNTDLWAIGG